MINLIDTGQCFRTPDPSWYDTDTDWDAVRAELLQFPELVDPINCAPGMQILRQPFVECVISFIISANNNIKRFTKTLAQMKFDLPWLLSQTEDDFRRMGCGYRAPYLVEAVRQIHNSPWRDGIADDEVVLGWSDEHLYRELRKIAGVGDKVARCVMLFCFHRLNIVPVDTWIEKAYRAIFKNPRHGYAVPPPLIKGELIAEQLQSRWGRFAGVAQQYIFYYVQFLKREL